MKNQQSIDAQKPNFFTINLSIHQKTIYHLQNKNLINLHALYSVLRSRLLIFFSFD